jgi:transcriptional regulator with XRE-family HTH domain
MISQKLKQIRRQAGINQQEAAKLLGCHRARIVKIESGDGKISVNELEKLIDAYGFRLLIVNKSELL